MQVDKHVFTEADHLMSTLHDKKKLMLHFYTKEVSEEEFRALEKKHLSAEEYGIEVGAETEPILLSTCILACVFGSSHARWTRIQSCNLLIMSPAS